MTDAFERIPELTLEWLTVSEDLGRDDAVAEPEVSAAEAFLAGTHLGGAGLEVRGEVRLPARLIRRRSGDELLGFLRERLIESEEFRCALVAGGVLGEAARLRGVIGWKEAEKN